MLSAKQLKTISDNMQYFYSANEYYKKIFGNKVYKLSLNAGMTCPNRDGSIGTKGCIFCSEGGSGDFASTPSKSIYEQIDEGIALISKKYSGNKFIAYFQAFTNTYAPVERLREVYTDALNDDRICGISIATRPDCLEDDKIELLKEINSVKPVWIELGLQTINESTAEYIRRGYKLDVFEDTLSRLNNAGLSVIIHIIIGLPGEIHDDYIQCAKYLSALKINGVKLQLLHVLKNTDLAADYTNRQFKEMTLEEYAKTVVDMIELFPPEFVIHRITGDGPRKLLIAPLWSTDKKNVLNTITKEFVIRNTFQGKEYKNGC